MSRWKAAGLHLCISVVIAAAVSGVLIGVWYPPPYFGAGGAGKLLALVVGVDVSIGPFLTLLVFKSGKWGMKFDLAVIGILQAVALGYGVHTIVRSRPVFMVAAVDRFVLVDADRVAPKDLAQASEPQWQHLSWTGPVVVAAELPTDPKERNALMFGSLGNGKDVQDFPRFYVPYQRAVAKLLKQAHSIPALIALNPGKRGEIEAWVKQHHPDHAHVVWLPIQARRHDLTMMLNSKTGEPLGALPLIPWAADLPAKERAGHRRTRSSEAAHRMTKP